MMKLNYSKILFVAAISTTFSFFSCGKQLSVEPKQSIDAATALTSDDDVDAAMVGAYSIMGGGALYGCNLFMFPDLQASENYCSWRGTFQGQRQIAGKTMTRDNTEASRTWIAAYGAINMANTVISSLGVVKDADLKLQLEGEALFVRGILHFELVRIYAKPWGTTASNTQLGVVIKTKATKTEEEAFASAPRNTVAEVYAAVVNDLTQAATKLPDENGTRVNRFTALAFLSRVYLQMGDYAKARDAASEVILSGNYKMNAAVLAVFNNKNTAESIWEIQQNDQNNAGTSNDGMATFYASLPGIGRADLRVTTAFVTSSYNAADLRRSEWYYVGVGARPGNTYTSKWSSFSQNLPVVRIAEMYLTRAECNLRLGTTVGAAPQDDLAQVRNPVRTNLPSIINPTLANVLNERNIELAFEGLRMHDFKRQKISTGTFAWNSDALVFPIPQREIDATQGVIAQNPGY